MAWSGQQISNITVKILNNIQIYKITFLLNGNLEDTIMERIKDLDTFWQGRDKQEHSGSLRTQKHTSEEGSKWGHLWGQREQFHHLISCLGQQRATCKAKAEDMILLPHLSKKQTKRYSISRNTYIDKNNNNNNNIKKAVTALGILLSTLPTLISFFPIFPISYLLFFRQGLMA